MSQTEILHSKPLPGAPANSLGFVLVVDDEPQNRCLLRDPLEAMGYEVKEAENGWQALKKIELRPPDVILLDLMMPEIDGIEVCRRLKNDAKTAHIPILMVTALTDRAERHLGIKAGANDFLSKPVDLKDVILRVGNAVQSKLLRDQLQAEQEKSERLLLNILPKPIADRMKNGETNIADSHPDTTVLLAELVGFTSLSTNLDPWQVFQLLNEVFSAFDVLVEEHGLEKIKTNGASYMVAGGISVPRLDHAEAMAALAIRLREEIERFNEKHATAIQIQIGICTGMVIAGIIGREKFTYDVWGETVNLACRLEATGQPGKIQISESTYGRVEDKYQFEKPHSIGGPGAGDLPAYWLGNRVGNPASTGSREKVAA
jgi:class 3 adenylate cyclase